MLDRITPLLLTWNEEANLERTLAPLAWAKEVLVVDSGSTDATRDILTRHPNVRVVERAFDDFAQQWRFGLSQVDAEWVLALDADYVLDDALVDEMRSLSPSAATSGYRVSFRFCVGGVPLRASLYPPAVVLFRRSQARVRQDGHCYRFEVAEGVVEELQAKITHDDRKPFARWLASQRRYADDEAKKLLESSWQELGWADRLRRVPFAAGPVSFGHCLVVKRGLLDGRAGLVYAGQRLLAETLISMKLLERRRRAG